MKPPWVKRQRDGALETELKQARLRDAAIRKQHGSVTDKLEEADKERRARRARRVGFEGNNPVDEGLREQVHKDIADIGQVKPETMNTYRNRVNAQFPSEPPISKGQSGAIAAAVALMAGKRGVDHAE